MTPGKKIKTVYLDEESIEYIDANSNNFSQFVNKAVKERIKSYSGLDGEIKELKDQIEELEISLDIKRRKLSRIESQRAYEMQQKEIKIATSTITRAIDNVKYKSAEDAIKDLQEVRGTLPNEVYRSLVEQIWAEKYGQA